MLIDQLPVEILMKIFSYLQRYDQVSLVNRQFYNVACKVNDSNVCLELAVATMSDLQLMESIRNTNRKITKIMINFFTYTTTETHMQLMIFIIKKFSAFIKYLELQADFFDLHYFLEILSLVPNAENLEFLGLKKPSIKRRRKELSNDDLKLHQLKVLKFDDCDEEFLVVFNRLPAGVLSELKIDTFSLDTLAVLFKRQINIKKFELQQLSGKIMSTFSADIFDNLQLESLNWREHNHASFDKILSKQTNLKFLHIKNYGIMNGAVMNVVANQLTRLETLAMGVSDVSVFKDITKLKKLNNLTLFSERSQNMNKLDSFAKINNTGITTLDIGNFTDISVDIVSTLAKSVPNLKILRFNFNHNYKIFNAFRRNFKFVEALAVCGLFQQIGDANNLIQDECINPKLINLNILIKLPYETPFLNNLINDYPNLKKLTINSSMPISSFHFKLILNGLTKIESLELFGESRLTMDDLDCLKDRKTNLKFILFSKLKLKLKISQKKKLCTMFDMVKFGRGGFLALSVDRTTTTYMNECESHPENMLWRIQNSPIKI